MVSVARGGHNPERDRASWLVHRLPRNSVTSRGRSGRPTLPFPDAESPPPVVAVRPRLLLHLEQCVLPEVPIRHWICTFPWGVRAALGYDKRLCARAVSAFV